VRAGEDYFAALDAPRRFLQDPVALEKRFYELSRALHPDRFTTAPAPARAASLERMSFLNDAYGTLKDRDRLRDYLLAQEGFLATDPAGPKPQPPAELAESWFELQDAITEEPEHALERLEDFKAYLGQVKRQVTSVAVSIEAEIDQHWESGESQAPTVLLERLREQVRLQSYVESMEKDVQRMRLRFNPGTSVPGRRGEDATQN
jgi:molecular chaperone HscB